MKTIEIVLRSMGLYKPNSREKGYICAQALVSVKQNPSTLV